jgi:glycosyltransferase involved in cell wall biosynthesis
MKLSIVTPVYHEEENILRTLEGIRSAVKTPYEFLIVYDAKDDPTYEVVKKYLAKEKIKNVRLVKNSVESGRGFLNALRTGFAEAKGDAVLVMMADLCDDPADIDAMYALFVAKKADIVSASRYARGGKQLGGPPLKRVLSRMAGKSLYYLRRLPTHDATNNFKLYRKTLLDSLPIESTGGFEIAMKITVRSFLQGATIVELPTIWRDRTAGTTKFDMKKLLVAYVKWYAYAFRPKKKP